MFTTDELKQLKEVVQDVVTTELKPFKQVVQSIVTTELKPVKEDIIELKKFAKRTDKKLKQIHQDQNIIIDTFDKRDLKRQQEIEEMQNYLHLPKNS